jgi:thiol-disulfide isomerase/thioredoxin
MVSLSAAIAILALVGAGDTVLLDFYADWCAPCRAMDSTVQAISEKGYPVRKVNIDREPALAAQYGVTNIPCFVMLADGKEVDRVLGGTTLYRLETACKKASPTGAPSGIGALASRSSAAPLPGTSQQRIPSPPVALPSNLASNSPSNSWTNNSKATAAGAIFPVSSSSAPPAANSTASPDDAPLAASVRLRIEDSHGHSCGSGTIIDARNNEALILTCGHIFRESKGKGKIEVDLFGPNAAQKLPGNLISYDLDRDVGLVSVRTSAPVASAKVAPAGYRVGQGEPVVSVGCNNGGTPTAVRSRVTAVDRYSGPPNIQVAGQPVEGRSGGGLFSNDGLVIGVCNARDPSDQEGYYAALASIHAELDRTNLAFIYKQAGETAIAAAAPRGQLVPIESQIAAQKSNDARPAGGIPVVRASSNELGGSASSGLGKTPLNREEQAALDEIHKRVADGSEVLCIVRSRRDPQAKSEIIVLDKASPEFLKQLAAEARGQDTRQLTSFEVPRNPSPTGAQNGDGSPRQLTPAQSPAALQRPALHMEWNAENR